MSKSTNKKMQEEKSSLEKQQEQDDELIDEETRDKRKRIATFLHNFGPIVSVIISFALYYVVFKSNWIGSQSQQNGNEKTLSLMILNARIWTGDRMKLENVPKASRTKGEKNIPIKWAEALAVHKDTGRIIAIGSNSDILSRFTTSMAETVLDFKQKSSDEVNTPLIVPGFIDSHAHVILGGKSMLGVQLRNAKSKDEFIGAVRKFIEERSVKAGEWITGAEWSETEWNIEGGTKLPNKNWIDSFTSSNPVYLSRMDGHSCLVNSKAMELANITKHTQITGGSVDLDPITGEPTGILRDRALDIIQKIIPPTDNEQAAKLAMDEILRNGITSVHDMGSVFNLASWDQVKTFTKLHEKKQLKVRIYASVELETHQKLKKYIKNQYSKPKSSHVILNDEFDYSCCWTEKSGGRAGDEWFKIGALKEFMDGSLGSKTAYMFEPFEGTENNTGLLVVDPEVFYQRVKEADANHHQVIVHAIGDKAISILLDTYERVINESNDKTRDRRFRVEHAQQIREEDIERFKKNNIIASMQPIHLKDDALYAESIIRERQKQLYNVRKFLNKGVKVALGTDWFVAPLDILDNIHAAVTRKPCLSPLHVERRNEAKNPKNCKPFLPEEKISIEETLIAYTQNSAYAGFTEHEVGTLKKGYLGDITILSRNILELDETDESALDSITRETKILMTIVGGKVMYQNNEESLQKLFVKK
ncbi:amidohydrolase [Naegleria gruberi]|uniref:Amidohydrolase n=1 Tax=Naegleria gruberi TaxID=5762 RepID=D2VZV6_NAEGR|nr:amidohydrolase [Naegleria gruberi]EFC37637.1 amidohydrolase [Naegleria gruberi]|eukprot:XP_002670381.1 amidohydrolase [Naegleria gruberi]